MIEVLYSGPSTPEGLGSPLNGEEHAMNEMGFARGAKHAPRRSRTHYDYQLPQPPAVTTYAVYRRPQTPSVQPKGLSVTAGEQEQQEGNRGGTARRRPPLGPPRRSYSVTDHEPIPHHHRPSANVTLLLLPAELHYAIFDFLDPIDSTCLGLTNSHFYTIHRRLHGIVPLSARRDGPNELEWAWHLAGNVIRIPPGIEPTLGDREMNALSKLRVRGQAYCRKCGVTRCELHKHIQSWMGEGAEYCSIKQKFGQAAPEGAKPYCYMSKPGNKSRCGRHRVQKSKVVLQ
ncbi:hypothetical protein B0T24DRAFT_70718 [Lasiosphaeria ovina]|uniref:F-box domain-containing protein n=1 Tax=Lasiosphaeria ovina TaxID=92902 RepID=A0AAE0TYD6_9PEZI|nr:hypothetical protein B0T24DRAFT_70718 [Lasiosphaeria ovina]